MLTSGCDGAPEEPATCPLEAAPSAQPVGGDANGDGHVDVSDGAYLGRAAFAAGPAPACEAAVDLVPDASFNVGDIVALWYAVGAKTAPYLPDVSAEDCPQAERTASPPCGEGLALGIDTLAEVPLGSFPATVTVTSPSLPVEAWSFTLTASGCTLESGTTAGTLAADKADGTSGLRDSGVAWQSVTAAEAHVLTVLDWRTQATLPTGGARAVHTFTVTAASCGTCALTLTPGDPAVGVESVVSAQGWRYVPALGSARVEICAG